MPFCQSCGCSIEQSWKFCPNCNTPLNYQISSDQAALEMNDSVIAGDVTITQQSTNITQQTLNCQSCGSEGHIILKPCRRFDCSKKACEKCREQHTEHCGIHCENLTLEEEREYNIQRRNKERAERLAEERLVRIRDAEQELKDIEARKKQDRGEILFAALLFIPGAILFLLSIYFLSVAYEGDDYLCHSGETIDSWLVLDENLDCIDGIDEQITDENQKIKQDSGWSNEELWGWGSVCGTFLFWTLLYLIYKE